MLEVSPWMWAWMGALAPVLWFARTVVWAFLVHRIIKTVVEKANVRDLPEVLTKLSLLATALSASNRRVRPTTVSAIGMTDDAGLEG